MEIHKAKRARVLQAALGRPQPPSLSHRRRHHVQHAHRRHTGHQAHHPRSASHRSAHRGRPPQRDGLGWRARGGQPRPRHDDAHRAPQRGGGVGHRPPRGRGGHDCVFDGGSVGGAQREQDEGVRGVEGRGNDHDGSGGCLFFSGLWPETLWPGQRTGANARQKKWVFFTTIPFFLTPKPTVPENTCRPTFYSLVVACRLPCPPTRPPPNTPTHVDT